MHLWNRKQICHGRLQTSFSKFVGILFSSLNFDNSLFLSQLTLERVIYLKRKLWIVVNENSFETGRISVMEGSRQVLVKVMLFQLRERLYPQDGAPPGILYESRSSLLMLSIDVLFVLKFFWKGEKNFENWTSGPIYMEDPVDTMHPLIWTPVVPAWVLTKNYSTSPRVLGTCGLGGNPKT